MKPKRDDPEVYRISGAPIPLSEDVDQRARRYLISMSIRTVCFLGCVLCWAILDMPILGGILLAGSLLLPYFAVVIANAGRDRVAGPPTTTVIDPRAGLGPGADDPDHRSS